MELPLGNLAVLNKILSWLRKVPLFPGIVLIALVFSGIFGSLIEPHNPIDADLTRALMPPFWQEGGTLTYVLGTDHLGRDLLSRIIAGARVSLIVGLMGAGFAGAIGTTFALLSGYLGGLVDMLIMRLTDAMLSMPWMMVAILIAGVLGASLTNIIIILGVLGWASYARVLRGEVLRIRESDFVRLAIVGGCNKRQIMTKHIFPNIVNTLLILATLQIGECILIEATLSFLGLGVPPPAPAWGGMLAEARDYISRSWWFPTFPGVAILLTVLACNLLGDWLRLRLDPKFRQL